MSQACILCDAHVPTGQQSVVLDGQTDGNGQFVARNVLGVMCADRKGCLARVTTTLIKQYLDESDAWREKVHVTKDTRELLGLLHDAVDKVAQARAAELAKEEHKDLVYDKDDVSRGELALQL